MHTFEQTHEFDSFLVSKSANFMVNIMIGINCASNIDKQFE